MEKLIRRTERVHRRAPKYILALLFLCSLTYRGRFDSLTRLPICYLDMIFIFKAAKGLINMNTSVLPQIHKVRLTRSSSDLNIVKFHIRKFNTTTFQRSFLNRTSRK